MRDCRKWYQGALVFGGVAAFLAAGILWASLTSGGQAVAATSSGWSASANLDGPAKFTDDGELIRPEGYRKWTFVGTPVTPNDMNGGEAPFPEFHVVYMDTESFEHYEETGEFRDGTMLVKELISVGSKSATSGAGYFMGEYIGLEVTIKDSERFGDEPGSWAYFSFGHEYPLAENASAQPAANCNSCHETSAAEDWVFTQYYPVLRAAKGD
ncbi:MAG: cytochrome P460 family protein [Pirellulaceae bacterium]